MSGTQRWTCPESSPWPARVLAAVVALVVTGPALAPGFVLLRDMVFVPRQDLDADALGLGGTLPRAVPVDPAMALLTAVVPGDVVQKVVLLAVVFAAVLGAARLVPADDDGRRGVAGLAAGLVYGWNPYVAERLLIGHWSLLVGYAALPWIARHALRVRAGERSALPALLLTVAAASLTPTGAVLGSGTVLVLIGRHRLLAVVGAVAVLASPWVVAGALHPGGGGSDVAGVAAFAARGENWGGPVVAVLGGGGLWNGDAVPGSRGTALVPVLTALLLALAVAGWRAADAWRDRAGSRLLLLGGAGLLLAVAGTVPGLRQLLELTVDVVPGAGLLRDAQKWAAWWVLPLALGAGLGVRRLGRWLGARVGDAGAVPVTGAALLLPVLAVPDLAWGVAGRLEPVSYPAAWQEVREALEEDDRPGDVLVLPFGAYRAFDWNDRRPQLDPAPRWLPRPAVVDDTLVVGGRAVEGEDPRARAAGAASADPERLAALGIGWVLVEHGTPGPDTPGAVGGLPVVVDAPELTLHRVPGVPGEHDVPLFRVIAVVVAHACALGLVGAAVLCMIARASTVPLRRTPSRKRDLE